MLRYLRHLNGPLFSRLHGFTFGSRTTKDARKHADDTVTVPDLREVMEHVYKTEAHLRTIQSGASADGTGGSETKDCAVPKMRRSRQ